jgi:HAD superfamily hydrolase (TIGR01484 family)
LPFFALATDYDDTLATNGQADEDAILALRLWRSKGRRLLLVTGRERESLSIIFPELNLFDLVVAENGALLYTPATGEERVLSSAPPEEFVAALRAKNVHPLSVGKSIVATQISQEATVQKIIDDLMIPWTLIRNRDSVMALPMGIDKGFGFTAALAELGIQPEYVMGLGDAENDFAFLRRCGFSVAVSNAVPGLRAEADLVTEGARGAGVVEAVHHVLSSTFSRSIQEDVQV